MKKSCFFLFLLFLSCFSYAQFELDYTPIIYKGTIPAEIIQNIKEKKETAIKNADSDLKDKEKEEFYTLLSYTLRNYFQSGYIYFNDDFTQYLNDVAAQICTKNNINKIKIYPSKVNEANAISWENGNIFFNIKLFNWIDNEAQLAYILGHEISHYTQKHSLKHYQFTHGSNKNDVFNKGTEFDKTLNSLSFSRQQELDADTKGYVLFDKTQYNKKEALSAMINIGKISDDEYTDYLSIADIFKIENDTFKDKICAHDSSLYIPKTKISSNSDDVEKYSTHPAIEERLNNLKTLTESKDSLGALFLVSKEKFQYLKTVAKFENIQHLFNKMDFISCLYQIIRLQKQFPNNKFLNVKAASCMYWIAWYRDVDAIKSSITDDYNVPINIFNCTLSNMDKDTYISFVRSYFNKQIKQYPDDQELQIMYAKLLVIIKDKDANETVNKYITASPSGKYIRHAKMLKK